MTRRAQLICLIIYLESCNKKENEKTNTDAFKQESNYVQEIRYANPMCVLCLGFFF